MNAFEAYKKYLALKLHFQQSNYDYFKFSGSVKATRESFETRRDRYFFQRLAKLYKDEQYEHLLVSNFIINPDIWIGEILSDVGKKNYTDWKKNYQSLTYSFSEDMLKIEEYLQHNNLTGFNDIFINKSGWPDIVTIGLQKIISLESFVIMNKVLNFIPRLVVDDEIVWPEFKKLCLKYSPFLVVEVKKYKQIMKNTFVTKSLDMGA